MSEQMRLRPPALIRLTKPTYEFCEKFVPNSLGRMVNKAVRLCILCVLIFNHHYVLNLIAIMRHRQRAHSINCDPFKRYPHPTFTCCLRSLALPGPGFHRAYVSHCLDHLATISAMPGQYTWRSTFASDLSRSR